MFSAREYVKARSLAEAHELNRPRMNAVLGGGTWLKMGRKNMGAVIDLSGLSLDKITETESEFRIGCMCTLRTLELHQGIYREFGGAVREALRHIVGVQFRNCATVGGSVFGRYGFSDVLTVLMALDTGVKLHKGGEIPIGRFSKMPKDRDILEEIIIKKDGRKAGYAAHRGSSGDFPLITAAAARVSERVFISVGARPGRAEVVELPDSGDISELAREAAGRFSYNGNMRGSGEYRRHLAQVYIRRALERIGEGDSV